MKHGNEFQDALVRARSAADKLDEVTEAMNAVIIEAEKCIGDLRLGVPGWIEVLEENPEAPQYYTALTFRKEGKAWRLMIESGGDDPDDATRTPLASASRDLRVRALARLPLLVQDMIERTEKEAQDVEDKTELALKFIESLKGPGRRP